MCASEKQIEANRLNAQKSTGPKTPEGKEHSSQNAIRHGLYSHRAVVRSPHYSEDPAEYEALHEAVAEDLRPENNFQRILVQKIADTLWRSRRVIGAETEAIIGQLNKVDDKLEENARIARIFGKTQTNEEIRKDREALITRAKMLEPELSVAFLRYEMRMERQMTTLLRLFFATKIDAKKREKKRRLLSRKRLADKDKHE